MERFRLHDDRLWRRSTDMSKQDYVLKKYVRAESAGEAILMDDATKNQRSASIESRRKTSR